MSEGSGGFRSVWICHQCEVLGVDQVMEPVCWNCGDPVTVTSRIAPVYTDSYLSGAIARHEFTPARYGAA